MTDVENLKRFLRLQVVRIVRACVYVFTDLLGIGTMKAVENLKRFWKLKVAPIVRACAYGFVALYIAAHVLLLFLTFAFLTDQAGNFVWPENYDFAGIVEQLRR